MVKLNEAIPYSVHQGTGSGMVQDFSVKGLLDILESTYPQEKLKVILNQPMQEGSSSIHSLLEKYSREKKSVPQTMAQAIFTGVKKRFEAMNAADNIAQKVLSLTSDKQLLQSLLNKKEISWIPSQSSSLQELIDRAEKGLSKETLSEAVINLADKVIQAKQKLDQEFGKNFSDKIFHEAFIDPRDDIYSQLSSYALDLGFNELEAGPTSFQNPPSVEELRQQLNNLISQDDDSSLKTQPTSFQNPPSVEMLRQQLNNLISQDDISSNACSNFSALYDSIKQDYGLKTAEIAYNYTLHHLPNPQQNPSEANHTLKFYADYVKKAYEDFQDEYEDDLVKETEKYISASTINYSDDLYTQLSAKATSILNKHESEIAYLEDWYINSTKFSQAAKAHALYTKTTWPGYETKGSFALSNPETGRGPLNDYSFALTPEIFQKLDELHEEAESALTYNYTKIEQLANKYNTPHYKDSAHLAIEAHRFEKNGKPTSTYIPLTRYTDDDLKIAENIFMKTAKA